VTNSDERRDDERVNLSMSMKELFESLDLLEERVNALSSRVHSVEEERDRLRWEVQKTQSEGTDWKEKAESLLQEREQVRGRLEALIKKIDELENTASKG